MLTRVAHGAFSWHYRRRLSPSSRLFLLRWKSRQGGSGSSWQDRGYRVTQPPKAQQTALRSPLVLSVSDKNQRRRLSVPLCRLHERQDACVRNQQMCYDRPSLCSISEDNRGDSVCAGLLWSRGDPCRRRASDRGDLIPSICSPTVRVL